MTLTEFLLARIAEDLSWARDDLALRGSGTYYPLGHPLDPARVLAECLAKRRAIDAAWADQVQIEGEWGSSRSRAEMEAINDCPVVVAALAEVYATHPDYDDTWPRYDTQGNGTT